MKIKIYNTLHYVALIFQLISIILLISSCNLGSNKYSRGIGIYPGKESESFAPVFKIDNKHYRNLALNRPAWHSSCYDLNLTAQLVTDGIIDTIPPVWYRVESNQKGIIPKQEQGYLFDNHRMTSVPISGTDGWVKVFVNKKTAYASIDSLSISGSLLVDSSKNRGWQMLVSGSDDNTNWKEIHQFSGSGFPGEPVPEMWRSWLPRNLRFFMENIKLDSSCRYSYYKLDVNFPGAINWNITELGMMHGKKPVKIGGPYLFTSAWMSAGTDLEWIRIDLGAECKFDSLSLHWINPATDARIEVSNDENSWQTIGTLNQNKEKINNLKLDNKLKARYIRLAMEKSLNNSNYILSEFEVYGTGGPVAVPKSQSKINKEGQLYLSGGNWKIQRESLVQGTDSAVSTIGYKDSSWLVATVPATVLMSYYNDGALPNPDFGDNQMMLSESFFYSDFWYRTEFIAPKSYEGKTIYLNFDGINWKAEIYLNGNKLGLIEGAFIRGKFDVTKYILLGKNNALAVKIIKNATPGYGQEQTKYSPGANGGELGADNPTFHASIGWDWIPTIRGRNIGIWNDVYLNANGPVTIENPYISYDLPLPDTTRAAVKFQADLVNHSDTPVKGLLIASIGPLNFDFPVELDANSEKTVTLDPSSMPVLNWKNPELWWPAGYGQPNLYDVKLAFKTSDKQVSDTKNFKTGVRQMTYTKTGEILKIWINGRRFVGKGGNWGFSESNLRYRAREYDIAVKYHSDMNFTMIRNWVGQTGDDEFFEACDKYGVMIWQDFWLANPVDGPDPDDPQMFLANAKDFILKIRNHPSMALYCGRNEGNPPEIIDTALRSMVNNLHADLHYISNSAWGGEVSGGGPYRAMPVPYYFEQRAKPTLHSEIGLPNIVSLESLKDMMPEADLWPREAMWGIHDFCLNTAQGGASFTGQIEKSFGSVNFVAEWVKLAQWLNYTDYRAIFEAQSRYRMGALLWMSHPGWPSLVWQTYDYYFEPTAAYFGCKKGSEPLHIQWNAFTDSIEVMNASYQKGDSLTARIEILNLDGTVMYNQEINVNSPEDSREVLVKHPYPEGLSEVYFLRLKLLKEGKVISENIYWRALKDEDYTALRKLPLINLDARTYTHTNGNWVYLITTLTNNSPYPALMAKVKVAGQKSGERILPVIYSDNYITLMPGESREISMEVNRADTRGERVGVVVEGLNIK